MTKNERSIVGAILVYVLIVGGVLAVVRVSASTATMVTASTNKITLSLQQLDSSNVPVVNRVIGPISYAGTVGGLTVKTLASGANTISLPATAVYQIYVKNLDTAGTVTIIATPQGGASATLAVLGPGAVFALWEATSAATYGYTAITLTASTGLSVEFFLGA